MYRRIVLGGLSGLVAILCLGTAPGNAVPSLGGPSRGADLQAAHGVQYVPPSGEAQRRKGRHPPRVGGREVRPDVERRRRLHEKSQRTEKQRRRSEEGRRRAKKDRRRVEDGQRRRAERDRRRVERQRRRADRDRRRARRDHRRRKGSRGGVDFFIFPPFYGYDPYYYDPYYVPRRRYYRSRISCKRARTLVRRRGYRRLKAYDCRGKVYGFYARRGGKRYKVRVSAYTGRILSSRRY